MSSSGLVRKWAGPLLFVVMSAAFFAAGRESAKALCCKVRKWYTNEDTQDAAASREQERRFGSYYDIV